MREIKFRGMTTNLVKNEFVYGYYQKIIGYGPNDSGEEYHIIVNENDESNYVDKNTIGQFTGLKDKNGFEIYEGDIVEHTISGNISVHEVYFDNEMLEFGLRYSGELFHCQFNDEFELVGNIHDNPELLNK